MAFYCPSMSTKVGRAHVPRIGLALIGAGHGRDLSSETQKWFDQNQPDARRTRCRPVGRIEARLGLLQGNSLRQRGWSRGRGGRCLFAGLGGTAAMRGGVRRPRAARLFGRRAAAALHLLAASRLRRSSDLRLSLRVEVGNGADPGRCQANRG